MKPVGVRRAALALPGAVESPHFERTSFRVRGRIFATMPPDGGTLNIFVDEPDRERMLALAPSAFRKLWWGKKVVGLEVQLEAAKPADVRSLLEAAWRRKAPKSLQR